MLGIVCALLTIACVLVTIRLAITAHTREVRAIAEEKAERRRIEAQHLANVSARWKG